MNTAGAEKVFIPNVTILRQFQTETDDAQGKS